MELEIVRGGGVGGLVTTTRLQTEALSPEPAQELESKVRSAALLTTAEAAADASARHPDDLLYEVTVEDEGAKRTLRFSDENLPEEVRSLIEWVDARPERELEHGP